MDLISGYIGLFQPPLITRTGTHRCSVYCIKSEDARSLIIIPLMPNYFEDAYLAARKSCYQNIYVLLPALDMVFVSDTYLLFYEIHNKLQKNFHVFCANKPQLIVTDEFSSYVHRVDEPIILGEWNKTTDLSQVGDFPVSFEFPSDYKPLTRSAYDIYVTTESKRILFCVYMTPAKLEMLGSDEMHERYDEIHIPFIKNIYGGMKYFEVHRDASARLLPKLRAYGFQTQEEIQLCASMGYKTGEVRINDFV